MVADHVIDQRDLDDLVLERIGTLYGDANLDGYVNATDFTNWQAHRFEAGTGWATGDFNGDGITDVRDFNVWNANKFLAAPLPSDASPSTKLRIPRAAGRSATGIQSGLPVGQLVIADAFDEDSVPAGDSHARNPLGPIGSEYLRQGAFTGNRQSLHHHDLPRKTLDHVFSLIDAQERIVRDTEPEGEELDWYNLATGLDLFEEDHKSG